MNTHALEELDELQQRMRWGAAIFWAAVDTVAIAYAWLCIAGAA